MGAWAIHTPGAASSGQAEVAPRGLGAEALREAQQPAVRRPLRPCGRREARRRHEAHKARGHRKGRRCRPPGPSGADATVTCPHGTGRRLSHTVKWRGRPQSSDPEQPPSRPTTERSGAPRSVVWPRLGREGAAPHSGVLPLTLSSPHQAKQQGKAHSSDLKGIIGYWFVLSFQEREINVHRDAVYFCTVFLL